MNICPRCHANGRSLLEGSCQCTGDVCKNSEFHVWNASRRIPYNLPQEPVRRAKTPEKAPKLVFGQKPVTPAKKR